MDLKEAREEIAKVDQEMAKLFVKRMDAVREVAKYKLEKGLPVEDKVQEEAVIKRQSEQIEDDDLRPFYIQFLQDTMDVSKGWQHKLMDVIQDKEI